MTQRKQKTWPQGNLVGWLHFCKHTAQSGSKKKLVKYINISLQDIPSLALFYNNSLFYNNFFNYIVFSHLMHVKENKLKERTILVHISSSY